MITFRDPYSLGFGSSLITLIKLNTAIIKLYKYDFAINVLCIGINITAVMGTLNRTKFCIWGTSYSGESYRGFQSYCSLHQLTVTKVEYFEFFPISLAKMTASLLSDAVVP